MPTRAATEWFSSRRKQDAIGRRIAAFCRLQSSYKLLWQVFDGAGWGSGGCWVFADALVLEFPGAKLRFYYNKYDYVDHVVALIDGFEYDGFGLVTPEQYGREERDGKPYTSSKTYIKYDGSIIRFPTVSERIARALHNYLLAHPPV